MIKALSHEFDISISALCEIFGMARSTFYYKNKGFQEDIALVTSIKSIFENNHQSYGTRRIKVGLSNEGNRVSRRRIARIMDQEKLVSKHTKSRFKPSETESVKTEHKNVVNQEFDGRSEREVLVSDTSYFKIDGKWHYLCIMLDLCGRFLEGFAASQSKDAHLAHKAILSIKGDLRDIGIFHSDKGSEFLNKLIDRALRAFDIKRSTSGKGNVFDNSVAESMFKTIKTEFIEGKTFKCLYDFNNQFSNWVKWYNFRRFHSSLDYLTPDEYRDLEKNKKGGSKCLKSAS
jgi:transposase InsO family protein